MPLITTAAGQFCYFASVPSINPLPRVTEVDFDFTSGAPYTNFTSTNGTSYSWTLYESSSFSGTYTSIGTGSGTPSGTDNISYSSSVLEDNWYYFTVIVTNSYGTASYTTIAKQCPKSV